MTAPRAHFDPEFVTVEFGDAEVAVFRGDDGALVVDFATGSEKHVRVWINDHEAYDGNPYKDGPQGSIARLERVTR